MTDALLHLYRITEPPPHRYWRAFRRFAIRFRNRMPVIAWLWRSTWEEVCE